MNIQEINTPNESGFIATIGSFVIFTETGSIISVDKGFIYRTTKEMVLVAESNGKQIRYLIEELEAEEEPTTVHLF